MVIGSVSGMAKKSMGEHAFVAVAVMAIGNAGGVWARGFVRQDLDGAMDSAAGAVV